MVAKRPKILEGSDELQHDPLTTLSGRWLRASPLA